MPNISTRGALMPASPIRKLVPLANAAKARGTGVFHLNIGQPDIHTPEVALSALKNIDRQILEYSPSEGIWSLRTAMSEYYKRFNINVLPDEIIITTGGSEAVNFAFTACLNPGDEVIIPEPAYANYKSFALAAGVVVKPITSSINQSFALPPIERFEEEITPKTRGILVCNPNNPTGYIYSQDEMEKIRDLVKKYDLYLFADEVYREFCYTDKPHVSAFHLSGIEDNIVLIDSVSKRYSECGVRIGALVTKNRKILEAVTKLCQARLSPPLLGQIVAEASYRQTPDTYMKAVFDEYISRRNCLIDALNTIPGVYSPMPQGAFYTVARLPIDNADRFCAWLLSDFQHNGKTVMLAPASGFYSGDGEGNNEVRIAYVLEKQELIEAVEVLRKALEVYPGRSI
ncbi:MAG: pyridoxal phosphate-dependent aminotransferase [Prevotellaceae bacterium]|jgi:aspartate aminotransferase|nr:pyridoxal phosphate-dependent aminotransferase [Prevotellaceae bacterium]